MSISRRDCLGYFIQRIEIQIRSRNPISASPPLAPRPQPAVGPKASRNVRGGEDDPNLEEDVVPAVPSVSGLGGLGTGVSSA